jgi:ankyrin repeat protein
MMQYKGTSYQDISPGSRGDSTLIFFGKLLNANADAVSEVNCRIFHWACTCLRGELGIALLSLFLRKNSEVIETISDGKLPIHYAAVVSSLDMVNHLLK